jgi:hypothetical protein
MEGYNTAQREKAMALAAFRTTLRAHAPWVFDLPRETARQHMLRTVSSLAIVRAQA